MKQLKLVQGSEQWKIDRTSKRNASEASIMMGVHANVSRDELLHMKATATEQEFSAWFQKNILDKGHTIEQQAREIMEQRLGEDLFPVVAESDDGYLSCSLDGLTMDELTHWECKQWNKQKSIQVLSNQIPECDKWQVVQCSLITGSEKSLYTLSDGTESGTITSIYLPDEQDFKDLIAGWKQFDIDLAALKAKLANGEIKSASQPKAELVNDLPAINYKMNGLALSSNLDTFKKQATLLIERSEKPMKTDDDFATADKLVKAFDVAEKKIKAISEQVLGEVSSIDGFCKDLKAIGEQIRQARLSANKKIKSEKDRRRVEIFNKAGQELNSFIETKNQLLDEVRLPLYTADFALAAKNKKTITAIQSSVNDELAKAKIDINQMFDEIQVNLKRFNELAGNYKLLFADLQQLISKEQGDFEAAIKLRISDHIEREKQKAEQAKESKAEDKADTNDEPKSTKATSKKLKQRAVERPSDSEIIEVLAVHFRSHESTVISWLLDMDLSSESEKLASNF